MFNPCCCNLCDCFTDDFNRADDSDLGADWTHDPGDFEIVGNQAQSDQSNVYALQSECATQILSVRVKGSSGDQLRLYVTDTIYIELEVGATAFLRYHSPARDFECGVTAAAGSWHEIYCVNGAIYLNDNWIMNVGYGALAASSCGFGTGTVSGDVYFDDFAVYYQGPTGDCPEPPECPWFAGDRPAEITVVIDDSDIPALNGTYVLEINGDFDCYYKYTDDDVYITASLGTSGNGSMIAIVTIRDDAIALNATEGAGYSCDFTETDSACGSEIVLSKDLSCGGSAFGFACFPVTPPDATKTATVSY